MSNDPFRVSSRKIMADQVKDETVRSPLVSSTTYESLWPRKEITLVLPPGTAGTKGVSNVEILADGFLRLIALSMNVHRPTDTTKQTQT